MSYSQLGQDLEVLKAYPNEHVGFFVDIGAYDGKFLSNTLLLEEKGWTGICAEPLQSAFDKLKECRKSTCFLTNKAVWHTTGETIEFADCDTLSGITGYSIYKNEQNASNKIEVKTISINDLLTEANAPKFMEYLSIDTEGTEYEILKALDHSKWAFGLIDVEHNYDEPKRTYVRTLLESNGYAFLRENSWDDCYIHKSLITS